MQLVAATPGSTAVLLGRLPSPYGRATLRVMLALTAHGRQALPVPGY